jgi:nicotinate-nucleotide pyrophosphorylase (carboxylating)
MLPHVRMSVEAEEPGVMSGGKLLLRTLELISGNAPVTVKQRKFDRVGFVAKDSLLTFSAHPEAVRHGIRVGLNLLQHMCGIATQTAKLVKSVDGTGCKLLDTRKTTPGLRAFEKMAVRHGGGYNHRYGRADGIIIKKEDIVLDGGLKNAIGRAYSQIGHLSCVEVEVENLRELDTVLADRRVRHVMLDNMTPDQVRAAMQRAEPYGVVLEVSGISPDRLREYATLGIPFISTSALILGAKQTKLHLVPSRQ